MYELMHKLASGSFKSGVMKVLDH